MSRSSVRFNCKSVKGKRTLTRVKFFLLYFFLFHLLLPHTENTLKGVPYWNYFNLKLHLRICGEQMYCQPIMPHYVRISVYLCFEMSFDLVFSVFNASQCPSASYFWLAMPHNVHWPRIFDFFVPNNVHRPLIFNCFCLAMSNGLIFPVVCASQCPSALYFRLFVPHNVQQPRIS